MQNAWANLFGPTLLKHGFEYWRLVMQIQPNSDQVMSIRQAARQDERLASILPQVHSGKISAIAPHEGMGKKATSAEQQNMAKAMNQLFKRPR